MKKNNYYYYINGKEKVNMEIPDCYDPVCQAEWRAEPRNYLTCEFCGEAVYAEYFEIDGEILCEGCTRFRYMKNLEDEIYV